MYLYKYFLCVIGLLVGSQFAIAQNIALNTSYSFSVKPNYAPNTAPSYDKTALTDGIYTQAHFWAKPTTVGWQGQEVSLSIDLGAVKPIGTISFNTARSEKAGVYFPKNIFVFVSTDNKYFQYLGDAADAAYNVDGDYQIKKFSLSNTKSIGRFVLFKIVPKGKFIFCDEIEVLKGDNKSSLKSTLIAVGNLDEAVDSLKVIEHYRKNITQNLNEIKEFSTQSSAKNRKVFSEMNLTLKNGNVSKNDLESISNSLEKIYALNLKSKYKVPFIVEKYNPWDTLNQINEPKANLTVLNYEFSILDKDVQYGAFVISNSEQLAQSFSFKISNINGIALFHVPYVSSNNYKKIPDPLVPIKSAINIDPGVSELFIFKITGLKAGSTKYIVNIHAGKKEVVANITTNVVNVPSSNNPNGLNANNWAYLNKAMLIDRQDEAVKDLSEHHINTIDVPYAFIPKPGNLDFTRLINYLSVFKGLKNVLLFTNYTNVSLRHVNKDVVYMSPEWKKDFLIWYKEMLVAIRSAGISSEIYLYPFDEVHGKDVEDFRQFAQWAKASVQNIKIYATLSNKKAIDDILPLIDIAQIANKPNLYSNLPVNKSQVWIYSTEPFSRSLPPYQYYRLMAWTAYVNNFSGVGFWNYADIGTRKLNLITDSNVYKLRDYAVIYDGLDKEIISSRRWEAFRLGIEDYALLNLYGEKFGESKAKAMTKIVLDSPNNVFLADSIRSEIFKVL